ncbi:MAG: hypothetical protein Q7V15_09010 [Phenylobacterium sp.]|nr:hypothetical protein [Phenylobacterium sp.]MDO8901480.1 hypothetical protein [Phenylobacterium sp.]
MARRISPQGPPHETTRHWILPTREKRACGRAQSFEIDRDANVPDDRLAILYRRLHEELGSQRDCGLTKAHVFRLLRQDDALKQGALKAHLAADGRLAVEPPIHSFGGKNSHELRPRGKPQPVSLYIGTLDQFLRQGRPSKSHNGA